MSFPVERICRLVLVLVFLWLPVRDQPTAVRAQEPAAIVFPGAAVYENPQADVRSAWFRLDGEIRLDTGEVRLVRPSSLAFVDDRQLLVADAGQGCFYQFLLPEGEFLGRLGREGSFAGEFQRPEALLPLPDGGFAVADTGNQRIQFLDRSFRSLDYFGFLGSAGDHTGFADPVALAVAGGRLYVVDRYNRLVKSYSLKSRAYRGSFGQFRFHPSRSLGDPRAIAIHDKIAAVSDFSRDRVMFYSLERERRGEFVAAVGATPETPLQLHGPLGLDFDFFGNLWVCDSGGGRVLRYDAPAWQSPRASLDLGQVAGASLVYPVDVKVNRQGVVAVLDAERLRILIFRSAWFARGREAYESNRWEEALEPLQRAIADAERTGTGNVYALFYLARSLEQLDRLEEAYGQYERLLRTFSFGTVRARAEYRMKVLRPMLRRP